MKIEFQGIRIISIFLMIIVITALLPGLFSTSVLAQTATPSPSATSSPAITSISLSSSPPGTPSASPAPNVTYYDVKVSIQVSGFRLVDKVGQANVQGEGHILYYWAQPPTFPGQPAYSGPGTYSLPGTTSTTFTWTNTSNTYGVYAAQLVNNDDTPLVPPVYAEIVSNQAIPNQTTTSPILSSLSLSTNPPSTPPVSPLPNVTYFDTTLTSQITNFNLIPSGNTQTNAPGEGHFVYFQVVDPLIIPNISTILAENYSFDTSANPFTFLNDRIGYRSYSIQLVNNDNTPLDPPIYAIIKGNLQPNISSAAVSSVVSSPVSPSPSRTNPSSTGQMVPK